MSRYRDVPISAPDALWRMLGLRLPGTAAKGRNPARNRTRTRMIPPPPGRDPSTLPAQGGGGDCKLLVPTILVAAARITVVSSTSPCIILGPPLCNRYSEAALPMPISHSGAPISTVLLREARPVHPGGMGLTLGDLGDCLLAYSVESSANPHRSRNRWSPSSICTCMTDASLAEHTLRW